jgi:hypothetical protein
MQMFNSYSPSKSLFIRAYEVAIKSADTRLPGHCLECSVASCDNVIKDLRNTVSYKEKVYCSDVYGCLLCKEVYHIKDVFAVLFFNYKIHKCVCKYCSEGLGKGSGSVKFDEKLVGIEQTVWKFSGTSLAGAPMDISASATLISVIPCEKFTDYTYSCIVQGAGNASEFNLGETHSEDPIVEFTMRHSVVEGVSIKCECDLLSYTSYEILLVGSRIEYDSFYLPAHRYICALAEMMSNPFVVLSRNEFCCESTANIAKIFTVLSKRLKYCPFCGAGSVNIFKTYKPYNRAVGVLTGNTVMKHFAVKRYQPKFLLAPYIDKYLK